MNRYCPSCGQRLVPKRPLPIKLNAFRWRIVEAVRRAGPNGIFADDLFDLIYKNDIDGGPLWGKKTLAVNIFVINKLLKPIGKIIRANGGRGREAPYVLRDL